jgi:protein-arginine kinase activator protein McsA
VSDKPSNTEEEYFARENAERLRKLAADQKKAMAADEREKLRKQHFMRCPKCGMELKEIALRGVQVDRCFSCNGLWLDEGELEKLAGKGGEGITAAILRVFKPG